jgi:hypothetical protein
MVGGEPLAGDPMLMGRLKRADFETVRSTRLRFTKAVDATDPDVPNGNETLATIESKLRDGLAGQGIQLSPILPEDDHFRFAVIEGARDVLGEIADPDPPFALYPSNVNQDPSADRHPFAHFQARWYEAVTAR